MGSTNPHRTPPHVYPEEQRHLEQLHQDGRWSLGRHSLVRFASGDCVWVLAHNGRWRWGVRSVTAEPSIKLLNSVRRAIEGKNEPHHAGLAEEDLRKTRRSGGSR